MSQPNKKAKFLNEKDEKEAQGWDAHSAIYSRIIAARMTGTYATYVAAVVDALQPARVLDVACGNGNVTSEVARVVPSAKIVATDFSEAMVAATAARMKAEGLSASLESAEFADAQTLEQFPDASFDCVTSGFGIFLVQDRQKAWLAAARVLKPGGALITTVWEMEAVDKSTDMFAHFFGTIIGCLPAELRPKSKPDWRAVDTADKLLAEVRATGAFGDARAHVMRSTVICTPTQLVDVAFDSPVLKSLIDQVPDVTAFKLALQTKFEEKAVDGVFYCQATANMLVAKK